MFPYILTSTNLTFMANGRTYTVDTSHPNYDAIIAAMKNDEWDSMVTLCDITTTVNTFGKGIVEVINGEVMYNGEVIHTTLSQRILKMIQEGFNVEPMVAFMQNLMSNPSKTAINELYDFLEVGALPITPDGHFLAYRRVGNDWFDLHSSTVLNKPADLMTPAEVDTFTAGVTARNVLTQLVDGVTTISMPRDGVDADRDSTCSYGLHFCSHAYLSQFYGGSGHLLVVKINPADVVSIPSDYNNTKGRCCKYQVMYEIDAPSGDLRQPIFTESVVDDVAATAPTGSNDNHTARYISGYLDGFDEGKKKHPKPPHFSDPDYGDGYAAGYRDGRGKKKRKYTAADIALACDDDDEDYYDEDSDYCYD